MVDYSKAKIYQILNDVDNHVYIGATCQSLNMRMVGHRRSLKTETGNGCKLYKKMNELGVEHFYIELIKETPCENKEQLRAIEGDYIRQFGTLNSCIAGRTTKQWRKENTEYLKEYDHQKWIQNKPMIQKYNQKYYQAKKHIINEKTECSACGVVMNKSSMKRHFKRKHS